MSTSLRALGLATFLLAAACGYRFVAGRPLPGGARSVHAPLFVNHAGEPGAEVLFTEAFRRALAAKGLLGSEAAEAVARGEIVSVAAGPQVVVAGPGEQTALALYRLSGTLRVRLLRGEAVFGHAEVTASEDYRPAADLLAIEAARRAALRRLAETLCARALERLRW